MEIERLDHLVLTVRDIGATCEFYARALGIQVVTLCFITPTPLPQVIEHLRAQNVEILEGPVQRTGATGMLRSIYFRDPDLNLLEVSNYM